MALVCLTMLASALWQGGNPVSGAPAIRLSPHVAVSWDEVSRVERIPNYCYWSGRLGALV